MTHNPPQPFYDAPIDRNHSVAFSYTAHTTNHDLMELSDSVWDSFPEETRNKIDPSGSNASNKKGKIHLRLLVVQLFHVWVTDPTRALSAPTSNMKRVNSIYNPKGISPKKLRLVLAALADNDYTTGVKHSYQRDNPAASTTKRIRASKKLHDLFTSLTTTEFDLIEDPNTPLVKLNENDIDPTSGEDLKTKHPVEYDQTLPHVVEMIQVLKAYNDLLRRTHIHLANIDKPYITRIEKKTGKKINVQITNSNKTVRRVFSRGDWKCYGRFHGGFWQNVGDKKDTPYRRNIRINNEPTVELDYSSLHPNMIRIENGLNPTEDVYTIGHQVTDRFDQDEQRQIMKGLVLNLINADNINNAYGAFRNNNKKNVFGKITNEECNQLVDAIRELQPELAANFGKDRGVDLMYADSQIINDIIKTSTTNNVPILTVHDSVICKEKDEPYVRQLMKEATTKILGQELNFDVNRESVTKAIGSKMFRDRDYTDRRFQQALETSPEKETDYHIDNWKKFQEQINNKYGI